MGFLGVDFFQAEDFQGGNWADFNPWAWLSSKINKISCSGIVGFPAQGLVGFPAWGLHGFMQGQSVFLCLWYQAQVCFFASGFRVRVCSFGTGFRTKVCLFHWLQFQGQGVFLWLILASGSGLSLVSGCISLTDYGFRVRAIFGFRVYFFDWFLVSGSELSLVSGLECILLTGDFTVQSYFLSSWSVSHFPVSDDMQSCVLN